MAMVKRQMSPEPWEDWSPDCAIWVRQEHPVLGQWETRKEAYACPQVRHPGLLGKPAHPGPQLLLLVPRVSPHSPPSCLLLLPQLPCALLLSQKQCPQTMLGAEKSEGASCQFDLRPLLSSPSSNPPFILLTASWRPASSSIPAPPSSSIC